MSNDDVTITRADARICHEALRHYAEKLAKGARQRDPLGALAMALALAEDVRRNINEQLAAPSPIPSAQDLDDGPTAYEQGKEEY